MVCELIVAYSCNHADYAETTHSQCIHNAVFTVVFTMGFANTGLNTANTQRIHSDDSQRICANILSRVVENTPRIIENTPQGS